MARVLYKARFGTQHRDACSFDPHQGSGNVESVLGQQLIQVVTGDPALELWKTLADFIFITFDQGPKGSDDLSPLTAGLHMFLVSRFVRWPYPESRPVVRQDFQALYVLDGFSRHYRVGATRVITNHPAQCAAAMGGGVWTECQAGVAGSGLQLVANHTRLDPGHSFFRINKFNVGEVLRGINDDGGVDGLPTHGCPCAPRKNGEAGIPAELNGFHHVI